jgi:hypothetical protein
MSKRRSSNPEVHDYYVDHNLKEGKDGSTRATNAYGDIISWYEHYSFNPLKLSSERGGINYPKSSNHRHEKSLSNEISRFKDQYLLRDVVFDKHTLVKNKDFKYEEQVLHAYIMFLSKRNYEQCVVYNIKTFSGGTQLGDWETNPNGINCLCYKHIRLVGFTHSMFNDINELIVAFVKEYSELIRSLRFDEISAQDFIEMLKNRMINGK